jgi:itaconyl-CoA hydratase
MFSQFTPSGPERYREAVGLDFEDFAVGQRFLHRPGVTMRQDENADEALTTQNQAMVHFDEHYAGMTEFKRPLMVSTLTVQRAIGLTWKTFGRRSRILGWPSIQLTAPVFGGDTLYAESTVLEVDGNPAGAPDCGRLLVETTMSKPDATVVARLTWSVLIYRRGRGPLPAAGY